MFFRLLLLFTLVPIIELMLLVEIGSRVGTLETLLLVLGTGILGAWLARSQGAQVFSRVQAEMARGALPAEAMLDGLLIFIAGAVLLTPGLLTDILGFSLLIPGTRKLIRKLVTARLKNTLQVTQTRTTTFGSTPGRSTTAGTSGSGPTTRPTPSPSRPSDEDPTVIYVEPD